MVSNKDLVTCPEKLRSRCSTATRFESLAQLAALVDGIDLVATTVNHSLHNFVLCFKFDLTVFLEASQMFEPLALGPLLLSKRFVMFGDYYTLNPLCKSAEADKLGLTIPIHRRLAENFP